MATNESMAANRGIDDVLNETEIGGFIAKNKALFISLLVLIIAGVLGYGIKMKMDQKNHVEKSAIIFDFVSTKMESAQKDKKVDAAFVNELKSVIAKVNGYEGANILVLNGSDLLLQNKMYAEALDVLNFSKAQGLAKNPYVNFLVTTRIAVAQEDLGQKEEAIKTLETLLNSPVKVLEGKLYLDLGRLYKDLGNKEKAKSNLEYVIKNSKEADFQKMAKLYLNEL